jgi:ribokinase
VRVGLAVDPAYSQWLTPTMDHNPSLFILGSFVVACSAKVDHLPRPGESLRASAFTVEAGGKGLNVALGAHRLGAKVMGIFAVGNDFFSQLASSAFTQAGLPSSMLRRFEAATGSGIGFTDTQGENCLAVHPGANLVLSAHEIRSVAPDVRGADLVVAQFETGDEPILEAFALARGAGRRTLLNPSPFRSVDPDILQHTSVLVLNRVEADEMARTYGLEVEQEGPRRHERLAVALLEQGLEIVVMTLGANGAVAYQRDAPSLHQPAFPIVVSDTLGAGDAFTAGLVEGLLTGRSLAESLRRAAACGAMVCRRTGVFDALPTASELETFLKVSGNASGSGSTD